ncbi:zinc finger domain-containing protein [Actinomyces sp. F1_1611]
MPEGHAIRRLALAFDASFVGEQCELSSPQGRFAAGAAQLDRWWMRAAQTKGKHLFLGFGPEPGETEEWIHVHLGLYGGWRFAGKSEVGTALTPQRLDPDPGILPATPSEHWPPEPRGAVRLRILTAESLADLIGPNRCQLVTAEEMAGIEARLGPDPLADDALSEPVRQDFVARVRKSSRPVGELVMDQSVSAGVGNIYRAEALFRTGINPYRAGTRVSAARLGALWDDFVVLMRRGVIEGAINTVEPDEAQDWDPEAERWYVYHRTGRPCLRCGTSIRQAELKGRALFWCPQCQR